MNILAAAIPKDQKLGTALPYIPAVAGLPPGLVHSRLDEISDFMELPRLRTLSTRVLELDRGRIIADRLYDPATEKQRQAAG